MSPTASPTADCPLVLAPLTVPCRGGACIDIATCACPYPSLGEGDFVFGAPSCDLNYEVVRSMWSVTASFHLVGVFIGFVYLTRTLPKYALKHHKNLLGLHSFACHVCLFVTGVLRAWDPVSTPIGTNVATSALFSFGAYAFWVSFRPSRLLRRVGS